MEMAMSDLIDCANDYAQKLLDGQLAPNLSN